MRSLLALALVSPLAGATTWVVDVDNGPGTDFTTLQAAITAASSGDTLLVMPGQYQTFVLDKSLAIVGQGTSSAEANFQGGLVQNLPAGSTTVLVHLRQNGIGWNGLRLVGNQGAVVIDDVSLVDDLVVTDSTDVRLRGVTANDALLVTSSRVEVADSLVFGKSGSTCTCCWWPSTGGTGGAAITVQGGEVHVARTTAIGGGGGSAACLDLGGCDTDGGDGGPGIRVHSGGRVLISGPSSEFVQGGSGGSSMCSSGMGGSAGPALTLAAGCEVRYSGVTLAGLISNQGGTFVEADPPDATLFALGAPAAGTILTLRVSGPVGSLVDLVLGRRPTLMSTPELDVEPACPVNRIFHLGPIPANGTISLNYPVAPGWPKGFSVVFQGVLTLPDTSVRYTNSVPAVVQ